MKMKDFEVYWFVTDPTTRSIQIQWMFAKVIRCLGRKKAKKVWKYLRKRNMVRSRYVMTTVYLNDFFSFVDDQNVEAR